MLCGWLHVDHIPVISHYQADRIKIETRLKQNRTTGLSREKNFNPFNAKGNFSHPTHHRCCRPIHSHHWPQQRIAFYFLKGQRFLKVSYPYRLPGKQEQISLFGLLCSDVFDTLVNKAEGEGATFEIISQCKIANSRKFSLNSRAVWVEDRPSGS